MRGLPVAIGGGFDMGFPDIAMIDAAPR